MQNAEGTFQAYWHRLAHWITRRPEPHPPLGRGEGDDSPSPRAHLPALLGLITMAERAESAWLVDTLKGHGYPVQILDNAQGKGAPADDIALLLLFGPASPALFHAMDAHAGIPQFVLLTNADASWDVLEALQHGADDCQDVSIGEKEILARIDALLRRKYAGGQSHRMGQTRDAGTDHSRGG